MKALILAGGYGTRLYPLTIDKPKALLEIAGRAIIDFIVDAVLKVPEVDQILVVTNNKFYNDFLDWKKNLNSDFNIEIINDKTDTNEKRLGAIKDIELVIKKYKIKDDLLVIGGDNLFEFNLNEFTDKFKILKSHLVGVVDILDVNKATQFGVVKLDNNSKIIEFVEKSLNPPSSLVAACLYLFPKDLLNSIKLYIDEKNNCDAPGKYIQWCINKFNVYGHVFKKSWYDIGTFETYKEANEHMNH